jgi:hypothetical protein
MLSARSMGLKNKFISECFSERIGTASICREFVLGFEYWALVLWCSTYSDCLLIIASKFTVDTILIYKTNRF